MTVNTTAARVQYNGNGVTTAFTVPFRFLATTHLEVIRTSASAVDTTLTINTDYTVTGAGAASGTVTMLTAPTSGEKLTIIRSMPFSQEIDLVNGDPLPAETLEAGLDARAMEAQQLREALDRSLTLPATAGTASTELPAPAGGTLIGWNSTGNALQNYDAASLGVAIATSSWITDSFDGDGVTTEFVLTNDAVSAPNVDLSVAGLAQESDVNFLYTASTKTVTFLTGAPPLGAKILARYGLALATGSIASTGIVDSTVAGRSVLTAADAAAARTAIGAAASATAALDSAVVHNTGNEAIAGVKTFSSAPVFQAAPSVTTAQSMVRLNTSNGYGSTNTMIRRYSNVVTNNGADITYADSASLGATFTINTSGVYAISLTDSLNATTGYTGASLNSANLTTGIPACPAGEILCANECPVANGVLSASWTGYLPQGAVVRPHGTGTAIGALPNTVQFTIARVA